MCKCDYGSCNAGVTGSCDCKCHVTAGQSSVPIAPVLFPTSYQRQVHEWVSTLKNSYWDPHHIMTRLSEEVGELAREVSHKFGPKKKKVDEAASSMEEEIGDILFTITCLCNREGINLDDAFKIAMDKCYGRDKDRFEKK